MSDTLGTFKLHPTATGLRRKRHYLTGEAKEAAKQAVYDYLDTMNGKKLSYTAVMIKTDMPSENVTKRLIDGLIREGRVTKQLAGSGIRFYCHGPVQVKKPDEPTTIKADGRLRDARGEVPEWGFTKQLDEWFMKYADARGYNELLGGVNDFRVWVKQQMKEGN